MIVCYSLAAPVNKTASIVHFNETEANGELIFQKLRSDVALKKLKFYIRKVDPISDNGKIDKVQSMFRLNGDVFFIDFVFERQTIFQRIKELPSVFEIKELGIHFDQNTSKSGKFL